MARWTRPPLLLAAAYGLLLAAWIVTNPPGASPDEPAHLVRARATARGEWVGRPARYAVTPEFGPDKLPWINRATRSFAVDPASVFPTIATCNAFEPARSSACLSPSLEVPREPGRVRSYVGSYQPFLYLPAGMAANRFASPQRGIVAGRVALGSIAFALLCVAIGASWRRGDRAWPLVGVLVATSPAVLFLSGSLSPNGIEIAGCVALFAVVLRILRQEDDARWWVAVAAVGVLVVLSRPLGPGWTAVVAAFAVALFGWRRSRLLVRGSRVPASIAIATVIVATAASAAWELAVSPQPARASASPGAVLRAGSELPEVLRQMIGVFGWLDTGMPAAAYAIWRVLVVVLIAYAALVASRRELTVLLGLSGVVVVVTVALAVFVVYPSGFGMQGRYVLPVAVGVPLFAGEILRERRRHLGPARAESFPVWCAVAVAIVQFAAWYANARRHAVGVRGPVFFVGRGAWSPPVGWAAWSVVVAAACALMIVAASAAARSSSSWSRGEAPSSA